MRSILGSSAMVSSELESRSLWQPGAVLVSVRRRVKRLSETPR